MIKLYDEYYKELKYTYVKFTGGEPHIELDNNIYNHVSVTIDARVSDGNDIMHILALNNALRLASIKSVNLKIPYFPGARQDRYEPKFCFTAKVYADLINSCYFDAVRIYDPHSPVISALLDNCYIETPELEIRKFIKIINDKHGVQIDGIIAPDLGASKRCQKIADFLELPMYQCLKSRDPKTGRLSNFRLIDDISNSKNLLVVDDICDGGGTFKLLADFIKTNYSLKRLYLFVSHGIFSGNPINNLMDYEAVGCTDSFPSLNYVRQEIIKI